MNCNLCPNNCNVDRSTSLGRCGISDKIKIAKYYLHKFEEPIISGVNGSGTIFFCGCSLKCVFCQNYELSRNTRGKQISISQLADIFKELEQLGAHNINLVTPTHFALDIIRALDVYKPKIPILYNTHGYENISTLKLLNDYVDIYLPDIKYYSPLVSSKYTGIEDYFIKASSAIEFMINSKPLEFFEDGMLKQGVIVRHLVLPQNLTDSKNIIDWYTPFKDKAIINVMNQYTPFGDVDNFPELKRPLTRREYSQILDYAILKGIDNMYYQNSKSQSEIYIPKWDF